MTDISYNAPPTVGAMMASNARVRVVEGPIGSGKSSGCVMEILRRAMEQEPGEGKVRRTRFAVIRNTYPELRDTTRKTFEQWIPPSIGRWNKEEFSFTMRFRDVECEVLFRALDKPQDIKKLLSLELTGAYVNEFRELPKEVFDMLQGRVGRFPSRLQGGPTWYGVWGDSNPWHTSHWLAELFEEPPASFELFRQPSGRSPEAENIENLPAGYYENLCSGKDEEWIRVYIDGLNASADEGSIYGALLAQVKARGDILDFEHGTDGVQTHWDLGHDDATGIWFWRIGPLGVDIIDHYESNGQPMSHYFELVRRWGRERKYQYANHWLPHDARAKTLQTGLSILDMCIEEWGAAKVEIVPQLSVQDGITAGRWLLEREGYDAEDARKAGPRLRFHTRCSTVNDDKDTDGLKCLRNYRRKWDEVLKVYSSEPVHDWASHTADAFRYLAVVVRQVAEAAVRRAKEPRKPERKHPKPGQINITLDEAWETAPRRSGGRIG